MKTHRRTEKKHAVLNFLSSVIFMRSAETHDLNNLIFVKWNQTCAFETQKCFLIIEFVFVYFEFLKAHRRTKKMTYNPNFDFGAIKFLLL